MKTRVNPDGSYVVDLDVEPYSMVTIIFTRQDGAITFSVASSPFPTRDVPSVRFSYGGTTRSIAISVKTDEPNAPDTERDPS